MMLATIFLAIFLIVAISLLIVAMRSKRSLPGKYEAWRNSKPEPNPNDQWDPDPFARRMAKWENANPKYNYSGTVALIVSGVCAALFLLLGFFSSVYTQDPGEAVVIRSWSGQVMGVDTTSGLGFKKPWETAVSFNIRNVRIEFVNRTDGEAGADGPAIVAPLSGSSNATINITAIVSIEPGCVGDIYRKYRSEDNFRAVRLTPVLRDQARNASTSYDPFRIKERRENLGVAIQQRLEVEWADDCVIIQDINLGEITLDAATENAITQVNVSRQQVETARNSLEESKIRAQEVRVDAQARADADQIIRCGAESRVETQVIGGEDQEVTIITPKTGDECENLLNQQVLIAKWLDVLTQLGADGNTTIVIPNDPAGGLALQPRIDLPVGSNED